MSLNVQKGFSAFTVHCPSFEFSYDTQKRKLFISPCCCCCVLIFRVATVRTFNILKAKKNCEGKSFHKPNSGWRKNFFFSGKKCVRIMLCWPHERRKKKYKFFSIFHNNRQSDGLLALSGTLLNNTTTHQH